MAIDGGLRPIFRDHLRDAMWTSIESGFTERGIPDSEYCFPGGISGWVEYKKTEGNSIGHVKPEQIGWMERRFRYGGRVFVAVRKTQLPGKRRVACDDLYIFNGSGARYLKTGGLDAAENHLLGRWENGPKSWNWDAVRAILTGPLHKS